MSTLNVATIKSLTASTPPVIQDSAGTEVGTLCRAWVNFNGTGTVAIRASFNVSSITDNGVGDYTVNFANAMPDASYSAVCTGEVLSGAAARFAGCASAATGSVKAFTASLATGVYTAADALSVFVAVFR